MITGPIETIFRQQLGEWLQENRPENAVRTIKFGKVVLGTAQNSREENEDRAFYAEFHSARSERAFSLLAVLDGIGGLVDGGECAELAIVSILSKLLVPRKAKQRVELVQALVSANEEIRSVYRGRGGATFAGLFIQQKRATSINVGDTRIYNFDPTRGGLKRLSLDDRLGDQVAKFKGLENIDLDPDLAGRLGQYLGMNDGLRPNVRLIEKDALRSVASYLLILTDGAYGAGDSVISQIMQSHLMKSHFQHTQMVAPIISGSSIGSGGDNATVVCAKGDQIVAPTIGRGSPPFEQLQVWTTEGSFTFIIPQRIPIEAGRPSRPARQGRTRGERSRRQPKDEGQKRDDGKQSRADSPKRELLIEQLSFEGDNEPTE